MSKFEIIFEGLPEDEVEKIFRNQDTGFRPAPSLPGRRPRYSHLADAVVIGGQIVSLANLASTLYKLYKENVKTAKTSLTIVVTNSHGQEVSVAGADIDTIKKAIAELMK